jgi:hypothetical protein
MSDLPLVGINPREMPDDINGTYVAFAIDKRAVQYYELVDAANKEVAKEKRPNAILPVIIEKITSRDGKNISIIINPESDRVRGRLFYQYVCPANTGDPECHGKNPAESAQASGGQTYCTPALSSPGCRKQELQRCGLFCGLVNEPCLCPTNGGDPKTGGIATYGFCSKTHATIVPVNCHIVERCEDYCNQDGDGSTCTTNELLSCQYDACIVSKSGDICQVGTRTSSGIVGTWNLIQAAWDKTVFGEQCQSANTKEEQHVMRRLQCDAS